MCLEKKRLLETRRFTQNVFLLFLSLLVFLTPRDGFSQIAEEALSLELNKPIEREISGAEKHLYQISLTENQYLALSVKQNGVDLAARLTGEENETIAEFDSEMRLDGTETVEFVAPKNGNYRIEIKPRYRLLPAGKYEIRAREIRLATARDRSLQEARNFYAEAVRLFSAGKYAQAQGLIERALEIRRNELGAENALTAAAMTHLARIEDALGKYDEAERINLEVLRIREKILGADHPDVGYTLNYLATVNNHKEDFQKALGYHRRALAVREKAFGENHPIVAVSLINLGVVYDALGDKLKAGELYERALKIQEKSVGTENLNFAIILNNIGKIYNDSNRYKKAEPFLLRAAAILEKLFPPDNPRIYDSLTNLAECYIGQNEFKKSETLYLRIYASREKTYGKEHPLTAHAAFNLGNLYALRGDFEKSEAFYRRALRIREKTFLPESPGVSQVLSALALLSARKGDIKQAIELQKRANQADEYNISVNLSIGSERQKLAFLSKLFDRINQNIFLQAKFAPAETEAVELAATTVLRQKGRVLDAVSNNIKELRRRFNPEDRKLLDSLNETTRQMAELILDEPETAALEEHRTKIKLLSDEREHLEDEISRRAAGFFTKSQPAALDSIKKLIPDDAALLEFAVYFPVLQSNLSYGEPRYVVYVLQNQGEVKWKDLGEKRQIDQAIYNFRQSLRDPKRKDVKELARALDEKIMRPLRPLSGDAKRLLISPDGDLNLIPFEALVDENGRYLVENYSFTYLTSGRDLLRMQTARAGKSKPLIIANPLFGAPSATEQTADSENERKAKNRGENRKSKGATRDLSGTYFAPLSGTLQEARVIRQIFPEAEFLTAEKATESALKEVSAPQILHIATHGFFLPNAENNFIADSKTAEREASAVNLMIENPLLRSGLAFAGANERKGASGDDDGILTALEASGLNLWGTKLVVLSACDTGLGEVRNGEGVYGLRRAFVLAGTESLVMSLWSVSDYATRELMTDYYKNLKQGLGRGQALRKVQLEMLKSGKRQHPFYWASFIQSGEWKSLDGLLF